jgi:hypothetical protein
MKKLYSLLLLAVSTVSFGQIFSDNLNYPDNALLTGNGWTAHNGGTTNPIDVGVSNGLTYTGYSGLTGFAAAAVGNAAKLDNTGQDVNKTFAAPVTTGTLYYTFLVNVSSIDATGGYFTHLGSGTSFAARVFVKASANSGKINFGLSNTGTASFAAVPTDYNLNATYLVIVKYDVSTTGAASIWVKSSGIPASEIAAGAPEHTTSGTGQTPIGGVYLRQFLSTQNITLDAPLVYATWFGAVPCSLTVDNGTAACDASTLAIDTYNVSFAFTGGNTGSYTLATSAGTIGGDNPSTTAAGNITISGVPEGTNVTLTVTGACSFSKLVTAPECKPVNAIPYTEGFPYTVGNSLGLEQRWTNINSGDNVVVSAGSLTYAGVTSTGNSVTYSGAGIEAYTPFTTTTLGTLYAAFLLNVTELQGVTDGNSAYVAGLTDNSKSIKGRLFLKRIGEQFQIGFDATATTTNLDGTLRNIGETVYIVMGYDFTNNALSIWINPTNGAIPTLGVIPAPAIANLGGFLLRQEDANTTPTIVFDELRVVATTAELGLTLGTKSNTISGLNVYPNPVTNGKLYITSDNSTDKTVAIYDILGKQVLTTAVTNDLVNVSGLNAGVYIVKITEAGSTATRKLIIR